MKIYKVLIVSFLSIALIACNGANSSTQKKFALDILNSEKEFKVNDSFNINIINKKNVEIDSIKYELSGELISVNNNAVSLKNAKLGKQELTASIYYEGKVEKSSTLITILSDKAPVVYTYTILNEYPHDQKAFTQGLEFYNDTLYESTGKKGQSSIRKVDYKSGEIINKVDLNAGYFGEGITIMDDKIYQLTWQEGTGFIYDLNTFKQLETFKYGNSKEGWGLANDGKRLFKSDGTEKIWFLNPQTLAEEGYIQIVTNTSVFNKANELEYLDSKIYANVWQKDSVMIIDANTGAIIGVIDFRGLKDKVTKGNNLDLVLNGIAYNPITKTFFVTGKNWDKLFEIEIAEK